MWREDRSRILETIKAIDASDAPEDVVLLFQNFIESLGFQHYYIAQTVGSVMPRIRSSMTQTNFPMAMVESRLKDEGFFRDPVVTYGMRTRYPFFKWSTAAAHEARYGQPLTDNLPEYGMEDGYAFSFRKLSSPIGGISLGAEKLDVAPDDFAELHLASLHCYDRLDALQPLSKPERKVSLSIQERDVLQFAAIGKTFWEMGVIMGVSEAAAKDAMRRARQKLDCINTVHAVSTAIARDLILP